MKSSAPTAIGILLLVLTGSIAAQRCSNIASVDPQNSMIRTKQTRGILDSEFRFRNGVFDEMEEPSGTIVDWHFQIVRDTLVRPEPHSTIRFIGILGDHLRGTGSRAYLIGLRCSGGVVENMFQQAGEGMRVISLSPHSLQLRFSVWKEADAHCCPSAERDVWFSWDAALQTYVGKRSKQK